MVQVDCSGKSTLADAIMDRISYDSYKINIESVDPSKDLSVREVYGLDPAQAEQLQTGGSVSPDRRLCHTVTFIPLSGPCTNSSESPSG